MQFVRSISHQSKPLYHVCLSDCKISHGQVEMFYFSCQKAVIGGFVIVGVLGSKLASSNCFKCVILATFKSMGTIIPVTRDNDVLRAHK